MVDFLGVITGLASPIGSAVYKLFTGNFLGTVGTTNAAFLVFFFAVFVIVVKKAMSTVINFLIIATASALFPLGASYLGLSMPLTIQTVLFFVVLGISIYIIFLAGKFIFRFLRPSK